MLNKSSDFASRTGKAARRIKRKLPSGIELRYVFVPFFFLSVSSIWS